MLNTIFLFYHVLRWLITAIEYCFLEVVKWFFWIIIWLMSPQQAFECLEEMEENREQQKEV